MTTKPLALDGISCRSHHTLEIHELNDKIVFLHSILGDVPKEEITETTVFPKYIVADFFSPNFTKHEQDFLTYTEKRTLYTTCCECTPREDSIVLNTMRYVPKGGVFTNNGRHNTLDKMIEIRGNTLSEIGTSPEPTEKIFSDSKTHKFGDYTVRMSSPFMMECSSATTKEIVWKLRLSAYLYTEIEEKGRALYFGTAGKGGRFYKVSLQDGEVIFSYDTGGTVTYKWHKKSIFLTDRKDDIIELDSKTGAELTRYRLKNPDKQRLRAMPKMLIKGNKLYLAAYSHSDFYDFHAVYLEI